MFSLLETVTVSSVNNMLWTRKRILLHDAQYDCKRILPSDARWTAIRSWDFRFHQSNPAPPPSEEVAQRNFAELPQCEVELSILPIILACKDATLNVKKYDRTLVRSWNIRFGSTNLSEGLNGINRPLAVKATTPLRPCADTRKAIAFLTLLEPETGFQQSSS